MRNSTSLSLLGVRDMVHPTAAATMCPGACHQQTGLKSVPLQRLSAPTQLAILHFSLACLQKRYLAPAHPLMPLQTSAGARLFLSASILWDCGGQLHLAPSEDFICQRVITQLPVHVLTHWDQTSPGSSGPFWVPIILTVILIVLWFRRAGHALYAAEPGTMGLKEHGKLLLKSMVGTACQDLGFEFTYCQLSPQQHPSAWLLMSRWVGSESTGFPLAPAFPRSHKGTPEFGRVWLQPSAVWNVLITLTPTVDAIHPHLALEIMSGTTVQSSIFIPPFNPKSVGNASARHLLGTGWSHPLADGTGGQAAARSALTRALCWVEGKAWQGSRLAKGSPCSICLPYPLCGLCFQAWSRTWKLFLAIGKKRKKKKKSLFVLEM